MATDKIQITHVVKFRGLTRIVVGGLIANVMIAVAARTIDKELNLKENLEKWSKKFESSDTDTGTRQTLERDEPK